MGYVILQNHEKIGYKVDQYDFEDPTEKPIKTTGSNPETAVLKEVNILIQGGKLDEAILVIKDTMQQQRLTSLELSDRFYHLLKMKKLTNEMAKHGIDYLDLLINHNNKQKALEVYLECQKIDPKFLPTAASLFKIGEWLNETGKAKASIDNFSRLIKAYPKNPLVPKAYFRAAQIFNDRLMNPDKAKKILTALLKQFPENEIVPQAKKYLSNM
jgi:tetratricopeptide (TPR) repeat protein